MPKNAANIACRYMVAGKECPFEKEGKCSFNHSKQVVAAAQKIENQVKAAAAPPVQEETCRIEELPDDK